MQQANRAVGSIRLGVWVFSGLLSIVAMTLWLAACTAPVEATPGAQRGENGVTGAANNNGGDGGADPAGGVVTGLPCDVNAILKARCQTCHSAETKYGASAPLVTFDDLMKPAPGANAGGKKVIDVLHQRVKDDARPMPPTPNPRLDANELATIDKWISGGAKQSSEACGGGPANGSTDGVKPLACKPDAELRAAKPFVMQQGGPTDQYVCFGVDVQREKKRHVIGFGPKVDNKKILHHILVFQSPIAVSSDPVPCEAFGSASWKLVTGWAPGGSNLEAPPEAGFPEEAGTTHWVLQLHYNNAQNLAGQTDHSGYELCTTEQLRPNDAGVVAFGATRFNIPPRSTTTINCDYRISNQFSGVKLFNASPHMHTRGVSIGTTRVPKNGGAPLPVFEQKQFDFENQSNFPITGSIEAGDVIRTRCSWKNPGAESIGFGEGTNDEMCFNFIAYYPNIPDVVVGGVPLFSWITPSANATCVPE